MKRILKTMAFAAALVLPGFALAQTPGAGLYKTVHDFANGAGGTHSVLASQTNGDGVTVNSTPGLVGLCTFCHTPHSAQTSALLWNHIPTSTTFTWDEATTSSGTAYPTILGPTYTGMSAKCLGCHDGTVSIGDVSLYQGEQNQAGYSKYKLGYYMMAIGAAGDGVNKNGVLGGLAGNHPVGVPYPYNQVSNTFNGITTGGKVVTTEYVGNPVAQNGTFVKLYNNASASIKPGAAAGTSGVECGSCHDVHNRQTVDAYFLRGFTAGGTATTGYLCSQCHTKDQ